MKVRTVVVDDEPLARERLLKLLRAEPEIEIVGDASNGREAIALIREAKPSLIFLDVQMPELDGFGVLAELAEGERPAVVFVTAYDKFALKAFDVHAIDYLLKPFDKERFQTALRRALGHLAREKPEQMHQQLSALLNELRPAPQSDRLAVKTDGRVVLVKAGDVDWVEAADNYVSLHVGKESHLLRETMASIEARLPKQFLRISRSTIVNSERIKELQPLFHGEYAVILRDGTKLTLSRSHRDKLQHLGMS
ncbi:MAG TPA: LytTR family DNA-binding domain-containing protein [Methylomirabilota bacterium]|nr:LytTR family DNA-binding domain-containing protein [Methylomirabilota bacterium]